MIAVLLVSLGILTLAAVYGLVAGVDALLRGREAREAWTRNHGRARR